MKKLLTAGVLGALFCLPAFADQGGVSLHLAGNVGLSLGGDKLGTLQYTNGDSSSVTAGGLVYLSIGPALEFTGTPISLQAHVGYAFDQTGANSSGADITFDRTYVDLLGFYTAGNHSFGAGLYQALSPNLHSKAFTNVYGSYYPSESVDFNDATGPVIEYLWRQPHSHFGFSVRAAKLSYDVKSVNGLPAVGTKSISGNFIGVGINGYW